MVFLGERKGRSRFLPRSLWLNSLGAIYLKPPSLLHRRLDRRPTKEKRACSIGRFSPRPCQPVIIDVYNSLFFFRVPRRGWLCTRGTTGISEQRGSRRRACGWIDRQEKPRLAERALYFRTEWPWRNKILWKLGYRCNNLSLEHFPVASYRLVDFMQNFTSVSTSRGISSCAKSRRMANVLR